MTRTAVHFIDSDVLGGAEQVMLSTLAGLDRDRWRAVLFHHAEPGLEPLLEKAAATGAQVEGVPRLRGSRTVTQLPYFLHRLRAHRPAVFHAHLNWPLACRYGLAAAALARVPAVVATVHGFAATPTGPATYGPRMLGAAGIDRYIAVSRGVAERLVGSLRMTPSKVTVVHTGVDPARYDQPPRAAVPEAPRPAERPIVLAPGRLSPEKGQRFLIEAAALVPEALFLLAGEGPDRSALEARARDLGVSERVVFLGYRGDVRALLAGSDLVALPSLSEGLPLAALEAMAARRPVVASAIGGIDEVVVDGETGILVPAANSVALAAAIRTVLFDSALAERLARAGRARIEQDFTAKAMVDNVVRVYDEVLPRCEPRHVRVT